MNLSCLNEYRCLDYANSNSVIGSNVNQFETPVRVDISQKRFSLSFISVVNLSMTSLHFASNNFFTSVFEFISIIFDNIVL